ncbi:DMT family transporter [bacterium]|nr:DMT family transporter [bacterium]
MQSGNRPLLPYFTLFLAVIFWGMSFVGTKIALADFSAFALVFLRFSLASLFFGAIMLKRGVPSFSRRDHLKLLILSLFQPWSYFIFETYGVQMTTASKASLIIANIPVVVLILSILILRQKIRLVSITGIVCSMLGVFLLISGDFNFNWRQASVNTGDILLLGAVLSAAVYILIVNHLGTAFSPVDITAMQVFYGMVLFAPEFIWTFSDTGWQGVSVRALLALLGLVLFATIGAFLCYNYALARINVNKAAIVLNGVPLVTVLGAWFLLDEVLSPLQLLGGLIVIAGVTLTNSARA